VLAVDGDAVQPVTNFDSFLQYKIGRKTTLTVSSDVSGTGRRDVVVKPVSMAAEKSLIYRDWVNRNRQYVDTMSGGRLGYVHMPDMSSESLNQLILDLDSDNQLRKGVLIDVRNNNGGFVNAYALDVLARRGYLTMTVRGMGPTPARTYLGQRSLELPTILLTNQHSLSDAEDFTEGYRALGLGKVVGEPTAGWIIYTSNVPLIDGSLLRIPNTRITGADGTDMEMHPRKVDVEVQRPLGESARGVDSQLDAAIRELLSDIDQQNPQRRSATAK
jgi:C-terminal processing protease CtpA/Prc